MKKILLFPLLFPLLVNAEVAKPVPYPTVKNGLIIYPEGNGYKEISKPCPKYNYDCNTDQIQKIHYSVYDEDVRCEQERCPNRLILKGYPYQKSFLMCPKETPLMDKNGKCYSCDTENNQIELPENFNNPCPDRRTFKPVNEKTLEQYPNETERLAPSCSADKPLLIQEGYYARCIDCNDEFENYPRVINKKDCDVCTNRTYISGWCVNGTKEQPLISETLVRDSTYHWKRKNVSCDVNEDIVMDYFEADWCSTVCPNRFRLDVTRIPNVYAYCVKKTIPNYIRNFWERYYLIIILFGIISLFFLPKILRKIFAKKD